MEPVHLHYSSVWLIRPCGSPRWRQMLFLRRKRLLLNWCGRRKYWMLSRWNVWGKGETASVSYLGSLLLLWNLFSHGFFLQASPYGGAGAYSMVGTGRKRCCACLIGLLLGLLLLGFLLGMLLGVKASKYSLLSPSHHKDWCIWFIYLQIGTKRVVRATSAACFPEGISWTGCIITQWRILLIRTTLPWVTWFLATSTTIILKSGVRLCPMRLSQRMLQQQQRSLFPLRRKDSSPSPTVKTSRLSTSWLRTTPQPQLLCQSL